MTAEEALKHLRRMLGFIVNEDDTDAIQTAIKALEQEPCEDAISRADMLDAIGHGTTYTSEDLQKIIKGMPPVNPQEPKTGHWFAWKPEDDVWRTTCSECGEETRTLWDYCPNCGTKMIKPQKSEGV